MLGAIYFASLALVAGFVLARPSLVLRPSVWFCVSMLIQINGAAAFASASTSYGEIDAGFPRAWELRLATLLFPLAVFGWVLATPQLSALARGLYGRCRAADRIGNGLQTPEAAAGFCLGCAAVVILAAYLIAVPPSETGLAAIFFDPGHATLAREKSLKLVDSSLVRYGYSLHCSVVAPLLVALLAVARPPSAWFRMVRWPLVAALFLSVMLPGTRVAAVNLLMVLGVVSLLRKGIFRGGTRMAALLAAALLIAALLSIAREGERGRFSVEALTGEYLPSIAERVCVTPYLTGVWTNRYTFEHGLPGIAAVRPLAVLSGIEYVGLPNRVGLAYMPHPIASVSVVTCFLFDFQASFGLAEGWLLALVLLCALDFLLHAFRGLTGGILVGCLAAFMTAQVALASSAFTVGLVTHGVLAIAAVAVAAGGAWRRGLACRGRSFRATTAPAGPRDETPSHKDAVQRGGILCASST